MKISYDNGITSGSCNPGWMYQDDNGDWRPIDDPFGGPLAGWADPGRPDPNAMTPDEMLEQLDDRGYEVEVVA
jgi:hypothetical protein